MGGLIGRAGAVRRRRRRSLAAAVLAAVAAAGWALQLLQPAAPPHRAAASWWASSAEGFDAATGVRAAVRYSAQPWGTEVEACVSGIRPGTAWQIWAVTATGQHAAGGGWTVTRGDPHAWYPASAPSRRAAWPVSASPRTASPVTIPLRPGTRTAPANAAGAPASIP